MCCNSCSRSLAAMAVPFTGFSELDIATFPRLLPFALFMCRVGCAHHRQVRWAQPPYSNHVIGCEDADLLRRDIHRLSRLEVQMYEPIERQIDLNLPPVGSR